MKVLFVPMATGGRAHFVPLLALSRMLDKSRFTTAFLLPREWHGIAAQLAARVLDVDHKPFNTGGFRSEMKAYGTFFPDIVVDDASFSTALATAVTDLPRVTMQRTGTFPGSSRSRYVHSLDFDMQSMMDVTFMGIRQPRTLPEMFAADCKIVPGIRSVERLPPALVTDPTWFFCGPLLGEDYLVDQDGPAVFKKRFDGLQRFFERNAVRPKVFVTLGTVARPDDGFIAGMRRALEQDIAVVSTVRVKDLAAEQQSRYYYAAHLPLHYVCKNVDLAVHQCGSGTYHYPLLNGVPSITIGTQRCDREDVAIRLQELGVSTHLKAPAEQEEFPSMFANAIERCLSDGGSALRRQRQLIAPLRDELAETAATFNFQSVLDAAIRNRARATQKSSPDRSRPKTVG